ncbi:ACP S-malonyltransferase [Saccharothrix isguenensis]
MDNDRGAFVFPGMGPTRFADVGKFMVAHPVARELVAIADERLGYSLVDRYAEADGDYSRHAQIAFLVNCLALARWAEQHLDAHPDYCAGPSFGGKAAAAFSGALSVSDAVWVTAEMARCLDEYFAVEHRDAVTQSFVRTPPERIADITGELDAAGEWYELSCRVDEDFAMLTLSERRVEWLAGRLRATGGLPLYVMRPPMHCVAFTGLARKVEDEVLSRLTFADPKIPVVADQDGALLTTGAQVRAMLLDGCTTPVDWPSVVGTLKASGVGTVHVCGQDALFGRVGVTTSNFTVVPVDPRTAMMPRRRRATV